MMTLPTSPHFTLTEIADGVYAAIAIKGSPTFNSIVAAVDLCKAAEELIGRVATFVAISHAHSDHWMGNQVFPITLPSLPLHRFVQLYPSGPTI